METESVVSTARLDESAILENIESFEFFQAVRLLETAFNNAGIRGRVGVDNLLDQEVVSFSTTHELQFPASEIVDANIEQDGKVKFEISFFGLTGPNGQMPVHYTEWIQQQRYSELAMSSFFDILNNRSVALFYRAWKKYRLPYLYEEGKDTNVRPGDPITKAFYSLIGITPKYTAFLHRLPVQRAIYFAGFFAGNARNAVSLEKMLSEYLEEAVRIKMMCGEWLSIDEDDRSVLPDMYGRGSNHCLGVDFVIGETVFSIENKFEIQIGPIGRNRVERYGPGSTKQKEASELCSLYVGNGFQFDFRYRIDSRDRPVWKIDDSKSIFQLGWNTWLPEVENVRPTFDDVVVPYSGLN